MGVGVSRVYLGLAGTIGIQGPEGVWGIRRALGTPRGCRGHLGVLRCQGCIRGLIGL